MAGSNQTGAPCRADQPTSIAEPAVFAAEVGRVREVVPAARTTAESTWIAADSTRMRAQSARMVADAPRGTAGAAVQRCAGEAPPRPARYLDRRRQDRAWLAPREVSARERRRLRRWRRGSRRLQPPSAVHRDPRPADPGARRRGRTGSPTAGRSDAVSDGLPNDPPRCGTEASGALLSPVNVAAGPPVAERPRSPS